MISQNLRYLTQSASCFYHLTDSETKSFCRVQLGVDTQVYCQL